MGKRIDHTGRTFGEWTALNFNEEATASYKGRNSLWDVVCSCGNEQTILIADAVSGKSTRCIECKNEAIAARQKLKSHYGDGLSDKHRLYRIWKNMNTRGNKNTKYYELVTICSEWKDFKTFRTWAETHGYDDKLDLDKDMMCDELKISPKIYSPETCVWVTKADNARYALLKDLVLKDELRRKYVLVQ